MRLLDIERASHGLKRRHAIHTKIEDAFKREWRDLDTLVAERREMLGLSEDFGDIAVPDEVELPFDADQDDVK
jgi:DNA sulfur modification protein DndC